MQIAELNQDKVKRLINIRRSDLEKKQKQERDELRSDISKRGMLGQGPGNQQLSDFFEKQLKELGETILTCYLDSIQPNKFIDEKLIKNISQHITATINNQSSAFRNLLMGDMTRQNLPKPSIDSFVRGLDIKRNMVNRYILDKLNIGMTDRNEKLGIDNLETNHRNIDMLDIFISHSGKDKEITTLIIDLLRAALNMDSDKIRCTSVEGYKLPGGADTEEQLRDEVFRSKVLIGIITPHSLNSAYVLFELGVRWGSKKHMIPLLANGTKPINLKGPLNAINCLSCDSSGDLHQIVDELATILKLKKQGTASYQSKIEEIVRVSQENVAQIKIQNASENKIVFDNGLYWREEDNNREGPFCQICYDNNGKMIHLMFDEVDIGESKPVKTWLCKVCGNNFWTK